MTRTIAAGLLATLAWAAPAVACSVRQDYRRPSNYDLIAKADLVVLARVVAGPDDDEAAGNRLNRPGLLLAPIRAIKGRLPAGPLSVPGYVSAGRDKVRPHPTTLDRVHPDALAGACVRHAYAKGTLVVAVFRRDGRDYVREGSPFARSVEDVEGVNGTWVRAADGYARIAALPTNAARRAALRKEALRLLATTNDSAAPAIAADMLQTIEQLPH